MLNRILRFSAARLRANAPLLCLLSCLALPVFAQQQTGNPPPLNLPAIKSEAIEVHQPFGFTPSPTNIVFDDLPGAYGSNQISPDGTVWQVVVNINALFFDFPGPISSTAYWGTLTAIVIYHEGLHLQGITDRGCQYGQDCTEGVSYDVQFGEFWVVGPSISKCEHIGIIVASMAAACHVAHIASEEFATETDPVKKQEAKDRWDAACAAYKQMQEQLNEGSGPENCLWCSAHYQAPIPELDFSCLVDPETGFSILDKPCASCP